jgi:hypothetical protein
LKALSDQDIGDDCQAVKLVLGQINAEYERLPEASILRNNVHPQINAMIGFYVKWNEAHKQDDLPVREFRQDQIQYFMTRRKAVGAAVNEHVNIVEAELALDFSSRLFSIMEGLPSQDRYFPNVRARLAEAKKKFLPGAIALSQRAFKISVLDPIQEYFLCIRKIAKSEYFEREFKNEFTQWAKKNLVSLNEEKLVNFRALMLLQALPSETKITKEIILELSEKALGALRNGRH